MHQGSRSSCSYSAGMSSESGHLAGIYHQPNAVALKASTVRDAECHDQDDEETAFRRTSFATADICATRKHRNTDFCESTKKSMAMNPRSAGWPPSFVEPRKRHADLNRMSWQRDGARRTQSDGAKFGSTDHKDLHDNNEEVTLSVLFEEWMEPETRSCKMRKKNIGFGSVLPELRLAKAKPKEIPNTPRDFLVMGKVAAGRNLVGRNAVFPTDVLEEFMNRSSVDQPFALPALSPQKERRTSSKLDADQPFAPRPCGLLPRSTALTSFGVTSNDGNGNGRDLLDCMNPSIPTPPEICLLSDSSNDDEDEDEDDEEEEDDDDDNMVLENVSPARNCDLDDCFGHISSDLVKGNLPVNAPDFNSDRNPFISEPDASEIWHGDGNSFAGAASDQQAVLLGALGMGGRTECNLISEQVQSGKLATPPDSEPRSSKEVFSQREMIFSNIDHLSTLDGPKRCYLLDAPGEVIKRKDEHGNGCLKGSSRESGLAGCGADEIWTSRNINDRVDIIEESEESGLFSRGTGRRGSRFAPPTFITEYARSNEMLLAALHLSNNKSVSFLTSRAGVWQLSMQTGGLGWPLVLTSHPFYPPPLD